MKNMGTETKVGIFVVLGILVLAYFTVRVGKLTIGEHGYDVTTYLDSAAGLDKNSIVRIAGVEVGKVTQISLVDSKAKVTLEFPKNVHIPEGSKVYVKSAGLLGEKYIEIVPPQSTESTLPSGGKLPAPPGEKGPGSQQSSTGSSLWDGFAYAQGGPPAPGTPPKVQPKQRYIQPGEVIPEGGPSVDVDRVLTQLSAIGSDIQSVTKSLSNVLGGPEGEKNIRDVVVGAKETMNNLQNITQTIDRGEGTLGKLVKDDKLYNDVKTTMANLQQVSQSIEEGKGTLGKLVKDDALYTETRATMVEARDMMANLNRVSQQIESGEGTLGKLVKDDTLYVRTQETMEEARTALANLNKVSQQIESGEGTLGKLVKDDTLYVKTTETMQEAKETMASLNKFSKQLESGEGTIGKLVKDEGLYNDARKAVKSVQKAADGVSEVTPVTVLGVLLSNVLR